RSQSTNRLSPSRSSRRGAAKRTRSDRQESSARPERFRENSIPVAAGAAPPRCSPGAMKVKPRPASGAKQGGGKVDVPRQAALMRIYTDEAARAGHKSLFEVIVCKARDEGLAGATVLRGPMGFGHSAIIRNASILNLSANLPLVIEIVDE